MIGQWYIFTQHYCLFSISLWRQFSFLNISIDVPRPRHFHVHFAHDSFNSSALDNAKSIFLLPCCHHTHCASHSQTHHVKKLSFMQHRAYFPWYILKLFLLWNRCGVSHRHTVPWLQPARASAVTLWVITLKGVSATFLWYVIQRSWKGCPISVLCWCFF